MKKTKLLLIFCISLLIVGICTSVFAVSTENYGVTTTIINGVTVKWKYKVNNSNQIIDLECTNPSELKGSITIPSTLEGKTVYSLGAEAFEKANTVTEFILPSSVKEIGYSAFENCTALSKVNLGSIESIEFDVFKGCTNLTSITIPKTLKTGATVPCLNNTNITKITLEEGLTVIPSYLCAGTGITEIAIPSSVKEIGYSAFENCTALSKVNLGSIESIEFDVFKGCTNLTSITIPKTLKTGATVPCLNNTNITKITLEEGLTVIPSYLCAGTGITEITIPNSVKKIEYRAFNNCTALSKVDLGSIESISFNVFSGCTSLTSITIPKTLKDGSIVTPCLDNPNITKITFEEGLTVIPLSLCANTGITEVIIPSSVRKIEAYAFDDCTKLNKITILDNVTDMGYYISSNTDSVFTNHNENLTIYCYKNSLAANYAIKYDIKYVYLTKEENKNDAETNTTTNKTTTNNTVSSTTKNNTASTNNTVKDTTIKGGVLPKTGIGFGLIIIIVSVIAGGAFTYFKYNNLKDIK